MFSHDDNYLVLFYSTAGILWPAEDASPKNTILKSTEKLKSFVSSVVSVIGSMVSNYFDTCCSACFSEKPKLGTFVVLQARNSWLMIPFALSWRNHLTLLGS